MKRRKICCLLFGILFITVVQFPLWADDWDDIASTFSGMGDSFKELGGSLKDFGTGMASSFGARIGGSPYYYRIVNDTSQPLRVATASIISFQGAQVDTSEGTSYDLAPLSDTKDHFNHETMPFEIHVHTADGKTVYSKTVQGAEPHADINAHWYRMFVDER